MSSDLVYIFVWWFIFLLIGVVNFPLCWLLFKKFFDLGYGLSKTIGILLISYIAYLLAIFKIVPLGNGLFYAILLALAIINFRIIQINKADFVKSVNRKFKVLVFQEGLFAAGLTFWSIIRGYQPDINGLEKFMDFGFVNSALRTDFLPPPDMWFAGKSINYYWFGHYLTSVVTRMSNIPSAITYNLMLATILGLAMISVFSIVSTLTKKLNLENRAIYFAGILSAFLLVFGGNFHTPFYVLKEGAATYWYPDATRFIGYNPDVDDKTIHEFPQYSFVVSDLHAHLIGLSFVLLFLALLLRMVFADGFDIKKVRHLLPIGFLLGVMFTTNAWDLANYSLVMGMITLLYNVKKKGLNFNSILKTGLFVGGVIGVALLTMLPFLMNFESLAEGVKLVHSHSPLWQLSILWGFPGVLTLIFAYVVYVRLPKLKKSDLFVIALLISSWILIILPEIIYVKDIYIASHYRANTMFKLTYQAFVMFYTVAGYIVVRTLTSIKASTVRLLASSFFAVILAAVLIYPYFAIKSYYGNLRDYRGLSGETWLISSHPDIYDTVIWLRNNVEGQPVILEAPGDSYTEFDVISSYTGLPTVSGWFVHEWLWRGDASFPQDRVNDITQIYTTTDAAVARTMLNKYAVKYVIVGDMEYQKFPDLSEAKFNQLATLVFSSGNTRVYKLN
jgi:uncharacterized membrane protein